MSTTVNPGDRVMALLDHGGYAEQAVASASDVFRLPDSMDFETAAGFPIVYGTSHIALWERAGLRPGETLVVHGAAGGVGLTAVEIGKAMGATVIATAGSAEKLEVAASRGADHLINYKTEDIRTRVKELTGGAGANVIYDPVGGDIFDASLRCIAWGGRILIIGFAEGRIPQIPANILLVKNIATIGVHWGAYRQNQPQDHRRELHHPVPLVRGRPHPPPHLQPHPARRLRPSDEAADRAPLHRQSRPDHGLRTRT